MVHKFSKRALPSNDSDPTYIEHGKHLRKTSGRMISYTASKTSKITKLYENFRDCSVKVALIRQDRQVIIVSLWLARTHLH